jgi:hypothetical protein
MTCHPDSSTVGTTPSSTTAPGARPSTRDLDGFGATLPSGLTRADPPRPMHALPGRCGMRASPRSPQRPTVANTESSIQRTMPSDDLARAHPVTCDHPEERAPLACNPYHRHELPRARSCRYSLGTLYQDTTPVECLTNAELPIRDHPVRKHALVLEPAPGTTPAKSLSTLTVAEPLCTSERPSPAFHRKRGRMARLARPPPPSSMTGQLCTVCHHRGPPTPSLSAR